MGLYANCMLTLLDYACKEFTFHGLNNYQILLWLRILLRVSVEIKLNDILKYLKIHYQKAYQCQPE